MTVADVIQILRRGRWLFLGAIVTSAILATILLIRATPVYVAEVSIVPKQESDRSELNGLASLIRPAGRSTEFDQFLFLLDSVGTARSLINSDLIGLLAGDKISLPDGPHKRLDRFLFGIPNETDINPWSVSQALMGRLNTRELETGVTKVELSHRDPESAKQLLTFILSASDDVLKRQKRQALQDEIKAAREIVLSEQNRMLQNVYANELGRYLVEMAELQTGTYAYEVIEPASVPPIPEVPMIVVIFIGLVVVSCSAVFVLLVWTSD